MKKIVFALCVAVGLAFGSEVKNDEIKEREVKLSQLEWADVQRGMSASNRYYFAEQKVTLVITNKVEYSFQMTLPPYRPIGRGATRIEPQDYIK